MTETWKMPLTAMSYPKTGSSKMVTLRWVCSSPESAAELARSVGSWVRAGLVWWDDLPLWQATFHLTCKRLADGAVVELRLWPQPESEA